jgi:eukaryotic-like serine/threonine-protein kinase
MAAVSSCPSPDRLRQLLRQELPPAEQADLVAHLDGCADCRRALERLAGAPPGLLKAAGSLRDTAYLDEVALRRVLVQLEEDPDLTALHRPGGRPAWVGSLLQPAQVPDTLGRLGDYDVTEVLGRGGMGLVLKANDAELKRPVAIKVLARELAGDPVARQRFAREARAAAAVRHPNVIAIHAVSEADGLPYLVMEYAPGGSLQDYLDFHGRPPWRDAARLGAEIAAGLVAAHERGLIHRDIKPSNVLLQTEWAPPGLGTAKIGDFGLARIADEARLTRTGIVAGTPMYMAPEQALCEALDARCDLFSLGSVLYTLLTGQEPFPAGSPIAVLRQVCEAAPRPVRELNPEVPAWLATVVERLQAKRPQDRFATAAEVAELLRYNLAHPDRPRRVAPPPGRPRPRTRPSRRLVLAVFVGALLAVGLLLGGALDQGSPPGRGAPEMQVPLRVALRGHQGPVLAVAFAPDGRSLATGSDDASLRFWDAATGREKAKLPAHSALFAVAFAHNGQFLVSDDIDSTLRLWDVDPPAEGKVLARHAGRRLSISPDDRTVAVGSTANAVQLWDVPTRKLRRTLAGHHGSILAVAFSPDGRTLASSDATGQVRLWDPSTGSERGDFRGGRLRVRALAFSPDSRSLASAGSGGEVRLWDAATGQLAGSFPTLGGDVFNLAFAPSGAILAGGTREGNLILWEVASARVLASFRAHQGGLWGLAFSPDGRTLATCGDDRLGKLWDVGGLPAGRP